MAHHSRLLKRQADVCRTPSQICAWDGGDCCAATCQPVTYATYYDLTAAQVANVTGTPNVTDSDVTSQLPFSCRHVPTQPCSQPGVTPQT